MRYKKNKKKLTLLFVAFIILIGVGYAFLFRNPKINGLSGVKTGKWVIYFDRVQNESGVVSTETKITDNKKQVDFNINLKKPGDYYEFDVDTVNDGNIDAMIDSVEFGQIDNTIEPYLDFDVSYKDGTSIEKCDLLPKNSRKTITVKVKMDEGLTEEELITQTKNLNLNFKINYVQKDVCENRPTLIVDPNGGKYNGTRKLTKIKVNKNSNTVLDEPLRTGYNFLYFTDNSGTELPKDQEGKTTVHVGNTDVKVTANWEEIPIISKYELTINPNGGVYNNSTETVSVELEEEETLTLEEPTRENYVFEGWEEVTETNSLSGNIVTMPSEPVTVRAIWNSVENYVARINTKYYTTIQKAFDAAVDGDTVHLLKSTTENGNNTKNISFNLGGFTVTGTITNSGTLTIDNGRIENVISSPFVNTGTVNVGTHDGNMVADSIVIFGGELVNGLTQNGTFNFYDGYIEGKLAVTGGYNELETGYYYIVAHDNDNNCQKAYLSPDIDAIARVVVNNNDIYFKLLQDAIDMTTNDNPNVYAIKDFENSTILNISDNQKLVFDLKGFNVKQGSKITNNGTFTIIDTASTKGSLSVAIAIENNGTLNLTDVTMSQSTTDGNIVENSGNINLSNANLTAKNGNSLYITGGGTITVDENTSLSATEYGIYNNSSEPVTIVGGNLTGVYNNGTELTINGSSITNIGNNSYAVYSADGTLNLNNVSVDSSKNGIYIKKGNFNIVGGTFDSQQNTIYTTGTTNISIKDSYITTRASSSFDAIYARNSSSCTCVISNTTIDGKKTTALSGYLYGLTIKDNCIIKSQNKLAANISGSGNVAAIIKDSEFESQDGYGLQVSGKIEIDNTSITSENNHAVYSAGGGTISIKNSNITSNSKVGLYNYSTAIFNILPGNVIKGKTYGVQNYSTGTINLTDQEDTIDSTSPVLIGEMYGLYVNNGTVNFYDGILKGKTDGYYGVITNVAADSTYNNGIEIINEEQYKTVTLKQQTKFLQVEGGERYSSLQDAFNAVGTSGTIKVVEDASSTETSSIASDQNIIFDLNGHTLELTKTITNNGTLTLEDNSENESGLLANYADTLIENKNMVTINSGTYQSGKSAISQSSNTAKVRVNSGKVLGTEYSIYSTGRAENAVYIEDGEFNSIYSSSSSSTTIKGGIINSPKNAGLYVGKDSYIENLVINHSGTANGSYAITVGGGNDITFKNVTVNNTSGYSSFSKGSCSKLTIDGCQFNSKKSAFYASGGSSTDEIYIKNTILTSSESSGIVVGTTSSGYSNNIGIIYIKDNTQVLGKTYGIEFNINSRVVLGENGSGVVTTSPLIKGEKYGIYSYNDTGIIEFYDGIVKGKTDSTIVYPDIIENGYDIKFDTEMIDGEEYKTATIEAQPEDFLQVGNSTFNNLQDAIDSIDTVGVINVISNGTLVNSSEIPSGKTITLDLGVNTLTTVNTITNKGTLIMKDSSQDNTGTIISKKNILVENLGQVTVESGTYTSVARTSKYSNIIHQGTETAVITINGGYLSGGNTGANSSLSTTIYNDGGILEINGGTITNSTCAAIHIYKGTTTINDVNNTEILSDKSGSNSISCYGDLTINGGTFKNTVSISVSSSGKGVLNMYGGSITTSSGYGINNSGTSSIYGGSVKGKTYGIYTSSSSLVIGKDDSVISTSSPIIEGETYGVGCYSSNKVEFYDGIVKGKTGRFQYVPKTIASGTNLIEDTELDQDSQTILIAYLEKQVDFITNVNKDKVYNNFKEAVSEASSGDLLQLTDSSSSFESVTIDKDLTIDLNNNSLTTSKTIVNTANLTIKDDSTQKNGMLTTGSGVNIINNSGTLIAENVHFSSVSTITDTYVINSTGKVDLTNVSINSTSAGGIKSFNDLDLNSCDINTSTYSIYSYAGDNDIKLNILDSSTYSKDYSSIYSTTGSSYKYNFLLDGGTYKSNKGFTSILALSTQTSNSEATIKNANFASNNTVTVNVNSTVDNITTISDISFGNYEHNFTNSTVSLVRNIGDLTINDVTVNGSNGYDTGVFKNTGNVDATDLNIITTNSQIALNNESGVFNFNSGQITNTSSSYGNYCVYIKDGTFNLKSGTIKNNSTGSNDSYGIYMKDGTLTIGTYFGGGVESADVSTTNPHIEAINTSSRGNYSGIGVKVLAGTFNYYDGLIIGSTEAKPEAPTAIEPRYRVFNTTDINGYDNCVLQYVPQ